MPMVNIDKDLLMVELGQIMTDKSFGELCFDFGLELDDVDKGTDGKVTYKVEVGANRYDLLCLEGLARSLLIFQGKLEAPRFKALGQVQCEGYNNATIREKLFIDESTSFIRPHCRAAVLKNIHFTNENLASFIDLQEKIHQNLARKRTLVAIGTHDLDKIQGPFRYEAKPPNEIKFTPLNQSKEYTGNELMDLYSNDPQLKGYLPIIRSSDVYPVIYDANNVVLSMPPIINGNQSKITLDTNNVFIEVTGTDVKKIEIALNTIITMFSKYCFGVFENAAETVDVSYYDGALFHSPNLLYRLETMKSDEINSKLGIKIEDNEMKDLLKRMGLSCNQNKKGILEVQVGPTRHDILHPCDIIEDIAIAYGYNKIPKTIPHTNHFGSQQSINRLTDLLRNSLAQSGFTEALTFSLCSIDDLSLKLRNHNLMESGEVVHIGNPKTIDFQVARTTLLPGLLKTVQENQNIALPLRLFEISDVVIQDGSKDVKAKNVRKLCALNYDKSPGFETIHGLLDRIMQLLEIASSVGNTTGLTGLSRYSLKNCANPTYQNSRCAEIVVGGTKLGNLGVLHPEVITKFGLKYPCAALEINIEPFC